MTVIYLICNNELSTNLKINYNENLELKREKRTLNIEGVENSKLIANLDCLKNVQMILASNYVSAIESSRYLADKLSLDIEVTKILAERKIGDLNTNASLFREMQEHNFNYKLNNGESLNECKNRLLKIINKIKNLDKEIAVFTHHVAIISLLSEYCEKGYNLDNHIILNYNDQPIIDGTKNSFDIFKLEFIDGVIKSIEKVR